MIKYNNMKSIPISSIPKNEMKQAISEWAEGSKNMKKLLWNCLKNNVETNGCHAEKRPYLEIIVNDSHDKVKKMLREVEGINGAEVVIFPDGGNPLSGPNWNVPNLLFSFDTTDEKFGEEIFGRMSKSLKSKDKKNENKEGAFEQILAFHDFFKDKESGCSFRIKNNDEKYVFSIESYKGERNLEYFNSLFVKAGLNQIEKEPIDSPLDVWSISSSTPEEFKEKIKKCNETITKEWSLEYPTEISEDMSFNMIAHIKKREFGNSPKGNQQFEEWFQAENEKIYILSGSKQPKNKFLESLKSQVNDNHVVEIKTEDTDIDEKSIKKDSSLEI